MIISKIKELARAKAEAAQLEELIALQLERELAGLHAEYGFDSVEIFIAAVRSANRGKTRRKKSAGIPKARRRAKITDATRAQVKKLVKSGKTGSQIAKALKISLPSVQNIKKALGLVKTAKKAVKTPQPRNARKKAAPPKSRKRRVSAKTAAAPQSKPVEASPDSPPAR